MDASARMHVEVRSVVTMTREGVFWDIARSRADLGWMRFSTEIRTSQLTLDTSDSEAHAGQHR